MAALTQQQLFTAFGLGEQVQEPAAPAAEGAQTEPAPAADVGGEGAQVQDPAAPASAEDVNTEPGTQTEPDAGIAEPGDPATDADSGTGKETQTMSADQRRQNAARRRQQEEAARQAAIDQAVQAARQEEQKKSAAAMDAFFKQAQLKNTITGEPITSIDQFNEWQQAFRTAQIEQNLRAGKVTREDLAQIVAENPAVKQAEQIIEQSRQAQQQADMAQKRAQIDAQVAEISKLDPAIQSVNDLISMPNAKEFYDLVKGGKNFVEAFKLANFERLTQKKAEAAQQQALSNTRGKDHLQGTVNTRGSGMASVPPAEMAMYRKLLPGVSEAEVTAHYNKYKKNH